MYGKRTSNEKLSGISMMAAALLLGATVAAAQEPSKDNVLAGWVGKEFTVKSSSLSDPVPIGGKLTLVLDSDANVRVCTRNAETQSEPWRLDFAASCGVTMTFTQGARYCTADDVKTGNAEMLASCHRLRARNVAMHRSKVKGAVELNDIVAFLVQGDDGKQSMTILVDSPARVTGEGGVIIITR